MAAVASRSIASPRLGSKAMSSPKDNKKTHLKTEERTGSPFGQNSRQSSPQQGEQRQGVPTILQPEEPKPVLDKPRDNGPPPANAPLAPPPRPVQNGDNNNNNRNENNQDYFGAPHQGVHLSKEPNPFENAFGAPSETPGRPQLPGVTSLTSPAPLVGGNTPGWVNSLRSGPLSPAMLTGPTGSNDYFNSDHHFAGSFPTPNESSLRTGLTPGGGGSMFPAPSPNSQAIFNAIQSGGATPGTLDFHRTAMHARAASQNAQFVMPPNGVTSQPHDPNIQPNLDSKTFGGQGQQQQQDQFEQHDANDAANGLFMLAQARGNRNNQPQQYPGPQQQPHMNYMSNAPHMGGQMQQMQQQHEDPNLAKRAAKNSVGSNMSGSTQGGEGEFSESGNEMDNKPQGRSRGKKGSAGKTQNGRRKAEDTPSKLASNKRQKGNNGAMHEMEPNDMDSDDDLPEETHTQDGRKLTDEEKRKNFLERNRIAALKCRQRKKQWLANLQQKVEIFSTENDALAATVTQLREEIVGLKTLLLAHKDCPVSAAQGISGMAMQSIAGEPQQYANPYGMGMPQGMQHGMQQANMQRR